MIPLVWWLRAVGLLYLTHFVAMVIARAPIRALGPPGALESAAAGDPVARFLIDTWVIFGLENVAIGGALLVASGFPTQARGLGWAIVGIEVFRGIIADIYMIRRTGKYTASLVWIVIHSVVIATGIAALR